MRTRTLLIAGAVVALGLPAVAQQSAQPQPAPLQGVANATAPAQSPLSTAPGEADTAVTELNLEALQPPPPPVEYPAHARRDPWVVGRLDPVRIGLGENPWGGVSGLFLSTVPKQQPTKTIEVEVPTGGNAH